MEWKICSQCLAQRNNKINTSIFKSYSFWCLFKTKKPSIFVNYNLWNETNRNLYNIPDTFYNFTISDKFTLSSNGTSETAWGTSVCVRVCVCVNFSDNNKLSMIYSCHLNSLNSLTFPYIIIFREG